MNKLTFGQKLKKGLAFKTIGSKIINSLLLGFIILTAALIIIFSNFSVSLNEELVLEKLQTDINYLQDVLSNFQDVEWHIKDGSLYCGDVLVGDATEENANLEPFYTAEEKTGTFVYTFMKCSDEGLEWTGDNSTGYMQGHYIRVAGTTKGTNGESIIGTYIDKKVADVLDEKGEYYGEANVTGGKIYCYYKTLQDADGETVGAIVVGRSMTEIIETASRATIRIMILIIAVLIFVCVLIAFALSTWTKAVKKVENYLNRIKNGELPDDKLELNTRDEITQVANCVNDMVRSLKDRERIGSELSVAADIQANLLPKTFPAYPHRNDFDLFASMDPAKEVGGDFYDFFMVDADHIALVIADVSGKGVPAALFMVTTRTLIKDHCMAGLSAGDILSQANSLLCEGNAIGMFVTGWLGIVELSTGKVDFANAGHNPPAICHDGEFTYLKCKPGFVLAGMEGLKYQSQHLQLEPGDIIFLYTDGVTESTNIHDELYGEKRLLEFLNGHHNMSMEALCTAVKEDTDKFKGDAEQFDDITMIGFKYNGGKLGHYDLKVEAVIDNIPSIVDFVNDKLEKMNCSTKAMAQIDVAIDEIASNIAYYAYKDSIGFMFVVIEELDEEGNVMIRFEDGGMPYNPLEREEPDITQNIEDRQVGGLGIHIVKKTMDDVKYVYKNGRNILVLFKKIR